jgi:S1-C subfamily serine protease
MNKWVVGGCIGCTIVTILLACVVVLGMAYFGLYATRTQISQSASPSPEVMAETAAATPQETTPAPTLPATAAGPAVRALAASELEDGLAELYREVEPSVVAIQTYVVSPRAVGGGSGSGFILDQQGHIVTNEHVVADADDVIVVFYDGYQAHATVLGTDVDSDLAILRVDELPDNVHPLPLGDSDRVVPGEWVVAIGNPFGLQNTITFGIVSAVGRMIPARLGSFSIPQAIQTDAAINPGNSGGPLINLSGQVIGVNAQIVASGSTAANAGVGFALPVNIVRRVAPVLMEGERYPWPWLGITGTSVDLILAEGNDLPVQRGAYIAEVLPGGPAEAAGLRGTTDTTRVNGLTVPVGGDVVISANGESVVDFADLLETVAFSRPEERVDLVILRDGREMQVSVTLERRPDQTSN